MQIQKKGGCEHGVCAPQTVAIPGIEDALKRPDTSQALAQAEHALRPRMEEKYVKALKTLRQAKRLIGNPEWWIKGEVQMHGTFCVMGAINHVSGLGESDRVENYAGKVVDELAGSMRPLFLKRQYRSAVAFNDHGRTTHDDIMSLLDFAAEEIKVRARAKKE